MGLSFFGLTSEIAPIIRNNLFTQIHEIVFHGNGGYDWHTIYNMPRWLRQFTYNKLQEHYAKEAESYQNTAKSDKTTTLVDPSGKVNKEAWKSVPKPITPSSKSPVKYG